MAPHLWLPVLLFLTATTLWTCVDGLTIVGASGECSCNSSTVILDCAGRGITSLPTSLLECQNLQQIHLSFNQLRSLQDGVFSALTGLQMICLSYNRLERLPSGLFAGLSALRLIDVNYNKLTAFPSATLTGLTALRTLILTNNDLCSATSTLTLPNFLCTLYADACSKPVGHLHVHSAAPLCESQSQLFAVTLICTLLMPFLSAVIFMHNLNAWAEKMAGGLASVVFFGLVLVVCTICTAWCVWMYRPIVEPGKEQSIVVFYLPLLTWLVIAGGLSLLVGSVSCKSWKGKGNSRAASVDSCESNGSEKGSLVLGPWGLDCEKVF
eukprot:m.211685 g.211685  ORF g.211685 m.211685 type:complete len:325 (-) comp18719_c0_seq1:132-1106(-)